MRRVGLERARRSWRDAPTSIRCWRTRRCTRPKRSMRRSYNGLPTSENSFGRVTPWNVRTRSNRAGRKFRVARRDTRNIGITRRTLVALGTSRPVAMNLFSGELPSERTIPSGHARATDVHKLTGLDDNQLRRNADNHQSQGQQFSTILLITRRSQVKILPAHQEDAPCTASRHSWRAGSGSVAAMRAASPRWCGERVARGGRHEHRALLAGAEVRRGTRRRALSRNR